VSIDEESARDATGRPPGPDARARAQRLDLALEDIDWGTPSAGTEIGRFDAPSGALATAAWGDPDAEPVVLVPGATGSKEDFALLAPLIAQRGYRVFSYDLAGQYQSADAGPRGNARYDYELFVRDLIAVLESVGRPAHLLGYSFAGIVAQLVTVSRPDLVRSLTLLTTPPDAGQAFRSVRWIGPLSWFAGARAGAGLMIWGIVTNKNRVPPRRLEFVRRRMPQTRRSSVVDIVALMRHAPDVADALAALRIPSLVAVGDHDLWPLRRHARFAGRIRARLAVYRTGHSPCETAPHQLALDMLQLFRDAEPN
jgi:pimeloyl-ACP methyl ester carboxylesterase